MIALALERVASREKNRRVELETLRSEIEADQAIYLERQRRHASKTFYHFGRLPIELASVIFFDVVNSTPAQVIGLSHVCRDWRRVVLEMPSLWFHLTLSSRNPGAKARAWKERSGGRLKSLSLHGENPRAMYALEVLNDIAFHHLRSLSLTSVNWRTFRKTLPLLSNDIIRQLETIQVNQTTWMPGVERFFELPDLQIRNLSLVTTDLNWRSLSDNCEHLSTFSYHGWFHQEYLLDLFALLHHNAQLERLHLNMTMNGLTTVFSPGQERRKPLPEIFSILPNLVELSLEGPGLIPESLIAIMVPSQLQVLHLTKCLGPLDEALIHLLTCEQPPHLRELVIDRCVIRDAQILVQVLNDAPSLKVLRLMRLYNIKPVLDALGEPVKDSSTAIPRVLLPHLEKLDLSYCPEVRDGPVMRVVKLRIPPQTQEWDQSIVETQNDNTVPPSVQPSQLASLALHGCEISGEVLPWLRKHVPKVEYKYATKKQANWKR